MIFLTKVIHRVFLIDFFTEAERIQNRVTLTLCNFLNRNRISTTCLYPKSAEELLVGLDNIRHQQLGEGAIIQFIGHGDPTGNYFGNNQFLLRWEDIRPSLIAINQLSNDGLIVNSTIMCYGENIFRIIVEGPKPFYAAIGSKTERSLQALDHNIQLYERCLKRDWAIRTLQMINDILQVSQGKAGYVLRTA